MGCETCLLQCPEILGLDQQIEAAEGQLAQLDDAESRRKQEAEQWTTLIGQRIEEGLDPRSPEGRELYGAADRHEGFAQIGRRGDGERRDHIESERSIAENKRRNLLDGCSQGPGKRFGFLGATGCRSNTEL